MTNTGQPLWLAGSITTPWRPGCRSSSGTIIDTDSLAPARSSWPTSARDSSSCGFATPTFELANSRSTLPDWVQRIGEDGIREYQRRNNRLSIDDLSAVEID